MSYEQDQSRNPLDDISLLAQIELGDEQALAQLYDRHSKLVYAVAVRICASATDAEDILQEVFFQIWQKPRQFVPSRGSLAVWLGVITRNRSIDLIRTRHLTQNIDNLPLAAEGNLSTATEGQEMMDKIKILLLTLPLEQRKVLGLAFFSEKTHREIATETGYPLGTIKTRIRTALSSLRHNLDAQNSHTWPSSSTRANPISGLLRKSRSR